MTNNGKNLYLVFYRDDAILPLPIWLSNEEYIDCLANCKKPRKFECIGSFVDGEFVPFSDNSAE